MSGHHPFSKLIESFTPERKARTAAKLCAFKEEMPLAELRQARERSQKELARALKVGQPAVAKLERRTDMYVSNLRRYIAALGGSLEIVARFPEGLVTITNFSDIENSASAEVNAGSHPKSRKAKRSASAGG
ncbi:MAG TPA: XRE family transcriptional regulator [Xanthobacteraceae bacterium]